MFACFKVVNDSSIIHITVKKCFEKMNIIYLYSHVLGSKFNISYLDIKVFFYMRKIL